MESGYEVFGIGHFNTHQNSSRNNQVSVQRKDGVTCRSDGRTHRNRLCAITGSLHAPMNRKRLAKSNFTNVTQITYHGREVCITMHLQGTIRRNGTPMNQIHMLVAIKPYERHTDYVSWSWRASRWCTIKFHEHTSLGETHEYRWCLQWQICNTNTDKPK